jgi:outer membrane protein assembly factor BamB
MRHPLLLLMFPILLGAPGWMHDGTSIIPDARPPVSWSKVAWTIPMTSWSNASPIKVGARICALSEPTTVFCVDEATGRTLWTQTNDWLDTLPAADRPGWEAMLAEAPAIEAELAVVQRRMSELRRLSRGGDAAAATELTTVSARLDALKDKLDSLNVFRTPPNLDVLGYTSPTPYTDGRDLYVMTGNGVMSRFTGDGRRVWSVWLGPPVRPMAGWDVGSVTSPLLVDGVIIAGHRALHGLDAATGRTKWRDGEVWKHYGTPGIGTIGGVRVAALPDGRILRVSDGKVLAKGLTEQLYTGPVVLGDRVLYIGTAAKSWSPSRYRAASFRLQGGPDALTATKEYDLDLPVSDRVYTTALVHQGLIYIVNRAEDLMVLDAATGASVCTKRLTGGGPTTAYQSPTAAGPYVVVGAENGVFQVIQPGRTCEVLGSNTLGEPARATPLFVGDRVYVRSDSKLTAYIP